MGGSPDNGNIAGGSDNLAPEWRRMIDKMRRKHPKRFLRISRKMLNHLCSIGLSSAQQMLAEGRANIKIVQFGNGVHNKKYSIMLLDAAISRFEELIDSLEEVQQ